MLWRRKLAKYSRWLHIYGSMISFAVVLFFAVTGITLNHPDWMAGASRVTQVKGQMDAALMAPGAKDVPRDAIVGALRNAHGLSGAATDVRVDESQVSVSFKGPGYAADAFIDRATGRYDLTESRLGLLAIVNDLHKGRDTGRVWKGAIDVSAGLLAFISATGLILLFFVHKYRTAGLVLLGVGGLLAYAAYVMGVP